MKIVFFTPEHLASKQCSQSRWGRRPVPKLWNSLEQGLDPVNNRNVHIQRKHTRVLFPLSIPHFAITKLTITSTSFNHESNNYDISPKVHVLHFMQIGVSKVPWVCLGQSYWNWWLFRSQRQSPVLPTAKVFLAKLICVINKRV